MSEKVMVVFRSYHGDGAGNDETVSKPIFLSRLSKDWDRGDVSVNCEGMMSHQIRADYDQLLMFPPSVEEWIGPDHPARFIRDFVDSLDLESLGFSVPSSEVGRPGMLRICV
jgi:hypothetical protein